MLAGTSKASSDRRGEDSYSQAISEGLGHMPDDRNAALGVYEKGESRIGSGAVTPIMIT